MSGAAVNVPTNFKVKEQDVNAKLQLYGIYSGELVHRRAHNKAAHITW